MTSRATWTPKRWQCGLWMMVVGGAHTPRGLVLNTSGFSEEEQARLVELLADRFAIQVSNHRVGSGYQLYIRAGSFSRFSNLISAHLVAPMRYKLPVDPVTTSPPRRRDGGLVRESEPIYGLHETSALIHQMR